MAAKSKKRLSKINNKLLKFANLELGDVICSICQSILIEPVTLPCFHAFCYRCFNGSVENNALCCPLCRLRIGSWLRRATKQKNLINDQLWNYIQSKFSVEIDIKIKGDDINLPEENPSFRLSEPGEIRSEYEAELKKLETERLKLEEKHIEETTLLIKKIQCEEEEAHRKYLESLQQDERLAHEMQNNHFKTSIPTPNTLRKQNSRDANKPKLKATKIDSYLAKLHTSKDNEGALTNDDDNKYADSTTKQTITSRSACIGSPEIVPKYGRIIKTLIDKKIQLTSGIWNKENGKNVKEEEVQKCNIEKGCEDKNKNKSFVPSLLVSLPLPCSGIRKTKITAPETRNKETGSADSMQQELCYFKPIEGTTPTSFNNTFKGLPIKVPGIRPNKESNSPSYEPPPSRDQYLEELCRLRSLSLSQNLPSAFVVALNILQVKKENTNNYETNNRSKVKKTASTSPCTMPSLPVRRNPNRSKLAIDGITKLSKETNLRRTRSMGSITKDENETTPKKSKVNQRKASSERKPYLRSDSKRLTAINEHNSPELIAESLNNNLAVKNLSSPLKNCDVKKILQEQLRIEKIIEQEKSDFELAQKMEAEWNGRRQPRRSTMKRQVTINYALRPSKKLKV